MALACGAAAVKGDVYARVAGIAVGLGWLGSALSEQYTEMGSPLYAVIVIDLALLLLLGFLSYGSPRPWPVWATVFHAVGLAVHVSYAFEVDVGVWLYYSALTGSAWGVLGSIGFGTWQAWRERAVEDQASALSAEPRSA